MNRRKLFGILPLSLLGLATAAKAETVSHEKTHDVYAEHICRIHVRGDGSRVPYPMERSVSYFVNADKMEVLREDEEVERDREMAKEEHSQALKMYDASPRCNQKFRHLRGARAVCPKCGGYSYSSKLEDLVGIPC